MVMKASLQLRIGTQLTMTPQLQQAIALLQLSTLDLRQEIQQALDANPMLEQEDEFGEQATRQGLLMYMQSSRPPAARNPYIHPSKSAN